MNDVDTISYDSRQRSSYFGAHHISVVSCDERRVHQHNSQSFWTGDDDHIPYVRAFNHIVSTSTMLHINHNKDTMIML
eukprot:scaffold43220_cov204-Skeletonema_marinoi.AAC.2